MDIRQAIGKVVLQQDLSEEEMVEVMNEIMGGEATPAQIGSFITGLRMKGETVEEITGAVRVMREKATAIDSGVDVTRGGILVDTCGTGGDGSGTFNVSTTTAFVVAGAGIPVAKHGNRSVSSHCGSADVLEAAGVSLNLSPEEVGNCIREIGIGFLFAPALHGAMKHAIGPRREIGIRTIFNILGPLTNPAGANVQVLGVFDRKLIEPMAKVLGKLGSKRALVVHGEGNLDELTTTGETHIADLDKGRVTSYSVTPEEVGLSRANIDALKGGETAEESARQLRGVLAGEKGAKRDMVLLNSGAALMAAGLCADLRTGVIQAAEIIDSGKALEKLNSLVTFSSKK
ncbi:MAG: anthranilate phosphoribosyltransferase [Proteobacteria bacterium]|nr:anthranilate phosphoribosyltransferase [Pseudomonadota bacterium]MBU1059397.1 anthranilate phosphoribosyltransferase [Pseudomonadota bacterium]